MKCNHCNHELTQNATMCPECGRPVAGVSRSLSDKDKELATIMIVASIVCAGIAVFFIPPLFGGMGLFLGIQANKKKHALAGLAILASVAGIVVGLVLGFMSGLG